MRVRNNFISSRDYVEVYKQFVVNITLQRIWWCVLKLDEANSVFVFAKKNSFNVHLCSVSCIKSMNDANFEWKNGLSFSGLMSSLLFCNIRIHDIIDMYVNYQKGEDVRGCYPRKFAIVMVK